MSNLRSFNYIRQLKISTIFKIGAMLFSFLAIPLMIKYLGDEKFGIWATMLTLMSWVVFFDLGIGNGLKNKITKNLSKENYQNVKEYISTSYALIGFISVILFLSFMLISFFIPWQIVFNSDIVSENNLRLAILSLSFFIFLNFWLSLVNQIYHGLQNSSKVVLGQFIANFLALFLVFLLLKFTNSSLQLVVLSYGISTVLSNVILTVLIFTKNPQFIPNLSLFNKKKVNSLLSFGLKFFVIQLAVLVIFMTDKIIITQLLGPNQVTPFEVLFRLFSIITISHSLILVPLWPAYTDAYTKGDFEWIKQNIIKQIKLGFILFFIASILAIAGPKITYFWIGSEFKASQSLYYLFAIFIIFSVWSNIFAYFVNAINKLSVQFYSAIFAAVINIPLSIFFVKYFDYGLEGIILATIISLTLFAFLGPIQVFMIISRRMS